MTSQGQIIDRGIEGLLKKKKNNKESAEKPDENENAASQQESANSATPGFSFGAKADVEDEYTFDHAIAYHMTTTKKNGKVESEIDMNMLLSDEKPMFGMETIAEGAVSTIIYEMEKNQMITLTKSSGTTMGMVIGINPSTAAEYAENKEGSEKAEHNLRKSGRTKSILGYHCEEWIMEDEKQNSEVWLSEDIDMNIGNAFSAMGASAKGKSPFAGKEYPSGTMLEVNSVDQKSGETSHMIATKVSPNSKPSISTAGYQFMTIPGQ